jgi:hypothetical protein
MKKKKGKWNQASRMNTVIYMENVPDNGQSSFFSLFIIALNNIN